MSFRSFGFWPATYLITDRTGMRLVRDEVTAPGFVKLYFSRRVGGPVTGSNALKSMLIA